MTSIGEWLNRSFPAWGRLTPQEKKAIRDFPILWAHFELYATNAEATPTNINAAVDALGMLPNLPAVTEAIDYFSARFFHEGQPLPVYGGQIGLRPQQVDIVNPVLLGRVDTPTSKLKAVLHIVSRLRNNFLHGNKARWGFEDQLENFQHSNKVLMEVIPLWHLE